MLALLCAYACMYNIMMGFFCSFSFWSDAYFDYSLFFSFFLLVMMASPNETHTSCGEMHITTIITCYMHSSVMLYPLPISNFPFFHNFLGKAKHCSCCSSKRNIFLDSNFPQNEYANFFSPLYSMREHIRLGVKYRKNIDDDSCFFTVDKKERPQRTKGTHSVVLLTTNNKNHFPCSTPLSCLWESY